MNLNDFIAQNDVDNAVVLLEGKRTVSETDELKLFQLGQLLATKTNKILFRSGNADGADYHFSMGVAAVDAGRLQVITPYSNHRQKFNRAAETIALDTIKLANESKLIFHSKSNKKTEKLVDLYLADTLNKNSIKAAYLIRDTLKIVDAENILPASFAIFYEDLENPGAGGTGHTIKVCEQTNTPFIDQRTWFDWIA